MRNTKLVLQRALLNKTIMVFMGMPVLPTNGPLLTFRLSPRPWPPCRGYHFPDTSCWLFQSAEQPLAASAFPMDTESPSMRDRQSSPQAIPVRIHPQPSSSSMKQAPGIGVPALLIRHKETPADPGCSLTPSRKSQRIPSTSGSKRNSYH